ncbi:MAG: branched-chain amino acid ABC transporter permease [Candidatus Rokubacteria bacterium]|nr:branched-chain amino acid ABC transporter permease [Candidatus Rokubacteria bacterium]
MGAGVQIVINGILIGGIYACAGLGFSLVWGVMNIINIFHGATIMLGAYITFWLFHLYGIDPLVTVPVSMLTLFLIGYAVQRILINRILGGPLFMAIILTQGLTLIAVNLAFYLWTGDFRSIRPPYATWSLALGPLVVPFLRLIIFVASLLLTALLVVFLGWTKVGRAIRATRMDRETAALMGVEIEKIYALTFAIGSAIAAGAGSLIGTAFVVEPGMGDSFLLKSFVVCVIGGLGNMGGALVGGLTFGLVETIGVAVFGPGYKDAIAFILLVVILLIRPEGLFGREYYAR